MHGGRRRPRPAQARAPLRPRPGVGDAGPNVTPPRLDRATLLRLYPALADLPPARLERLLQPAALFQLPAGACVFSEHQPCTGFPLLLDGSIKVVKQASSGRELLLYRVSPGGSCIISSSLPARPYRLQRARHRRNPAHPARPAARRIRAAASRPCAVPRFRLPPVFRAHRRADATGRGSRLRPPRPTAGQAAPGPPCRYAEHHPPATGRRTGQRARDRQPPCSRASPPRAWSA